MTYMGNKKFIFNSVVSCLMLVTIFLLCESCSEPPRITAPVNKVDQIFYYAQKFSVGHDIGSVIEQEFSQLTSNDLEKLQGKREGMDDFAVYLTRGKASQAINNVIDKYLSKEVRSSRLHVSMRGKILMCGLLNKNRNNQEEKIDRINEIAMILKYFPEIVNDILMPDNSFDVVLFDEIATILDVEPTIQVLSNLQRKNFTAWISWVSLPTYNGHGFKNLYYNVSDVHKDILRSNLLSSVMQASESRHELINYFIDNIDRYGLENDTNTDVYSISSVIPGTSIFGSLVYVLVKKLIEEKINFPNTKNRDFADVRILAKKWRRFFVNDESYLTFINNNSTVTTHESIINILQNTLGVEAREFAHYYLGYDKISDVYDATQNLSMSSADLLGLYKKLITSPEQAIDLAKMVSLENDNFLHKLLQRPIESGDHLYLLIEDFLHKIGLDNEKNMLLSNSDKNNKNPMQIFLQSVSDEKFPRKLFSRLIENDDKELASTFTDAMIINLTKKFYLARYESGDKDFKKLYQLLNSEKQFLMRSHLIEFALDKGIENFREILDAIFKDVDSFGLRKNLKNDTYKLKSYNGSLLFCLTKYFLSLPDKESGLSEIRYAAATIKNVLNDSYDEYIYQKKWANEAISSLVTSALKINNLEDLANYYLAHELPQDVLSASKKSVKLVSNKSLKMIYDLIIGYDKNANEQLSALNDSQNKFITYLLNRPIDSDGFLSNILHKFLDNLSLQNEQLQIISDQTTKAPLKILFNKDRSTILAEHDDCSFKINMMMRMLRHAANVVALNGVDEEDLIQSMPIMLKNPLIFFHVYRLYGTNSLFAQTMRNALLKEAINQGHTTVKNLVIALTNLDDVFGLKDTLASDVYAILPDSKRDEKISGSLVHVLATHTLSQESMASIHDIFRLKENLERIKNEIGYNLYNDLVSNISKISEHSTISTLESLLPLEKRPFISSYLSIENIKDVLSACILPEKDFSNERLREIYDMVIANNNEKSFNLSVERLNDTNFIHCLLKRSVDENGHLTALLNAYLKQIFEYGEMQGQGKTKVQEVLNASINGKYPLQNIMAIDRLHDDAYHKASIINSLVRYGNINGIQALTAEELSQVKLFYEPNGYAAFGIIYRALISDAKKSLILRSALFNHAKDQTQLKKLVEVIVDDQDILGLRSSILIDSYLSNNKMKSLLHVLTDYAVEQNTIIGYKNLRAEALAISKVLNNHYHAIVERPSCAGNDTPLMLLKEKFLQTMPGAAEYYLNYDKNIGDKTILSSLSIKTNSEISAWLFHVSMSDPKECLNLAFSHKPQEEGLMHRLLRREISISSESIFNKVIDDIAVLDSTKLKDLFFDIGIGKNPLQILLDPARKDKNKKNFRAMVIKIMRSAPEVAQTIVEPSYAFNLLKILAPQKELVQQAIRYFPRETMIAVSKWCAENISQDVGSFFLERISLESEEMQKMMLTTLINNAYEAGYLQSTYQGGADMVADLLDNNYFTRSLFISQPFLKEIIALTKPRSPHQLAKIIFAAKNLIGDNDWHTFLIEKNSHKNQENMIDLLMRISRIDEKTAHMWLMD